MKLAITIIMVLTAIFVLPAMGESAQFWYDQANGYFISGDYEKAAASYDKALELVPNSTVLWNYKGRVLGMLGRHEDAISCFDKSLAINSSNPESMSLKAIALSQGLKKYSEAIAIFDQVLAANASYFDAWIGKGMALANDGNLYSSLECFEKATQIKPQDPSAWNNKGVVLRQMERYQDALTCFNKALSIDSTYETALQNRESTLQDMDQTPQSSSSQSTQDML
ncbi:MAG: tetratricopeptide repeat protein [Methanothrix sp.]|nr:tetratricopeptide repeat protein [Methanothrix sp.]